MRWSIGINFRSNNLPAAADKPTKAPVKRTQVDPIFKDPKGEESPLSWHDHLPDGDEERDLDDPDFWHAVAMSKKD